MSLAIPLSAQCRLAHDSPMVAESTIPTNGRRLGRIFKPTPSSSRFVCPATLT